MKKELLYALIFLSFLSTSDEVNAKQRQSRTSGIEYYKLNGEKIKESAITTDITGELSFFYEGNPISMTFNNGALEGPFQLNGIEGTVNSDGGFSFLKGDDLIGSGQLSCSGLEIFKTYVKQFKNPTPLNMGNFYKCLTIKDLNYSNQLGSLSLNGAFKFPKLTENTTVSFIPNSSVIKSSNHEAYPKKLFLDIDKNGRNFSFSYILKDDKKLSAHFLIEDDFENHISRFHQQKYDNMLNKEELTHLILTKVLIPQLNGSDGVVFDGSYSFKKGFENKNTFKVFSPENKDVIDLSIVDNRIFTNLKYPKSMTSFIEGEVSGQSLDTAFDVVTGISFSSFEKMFQMSDQKVANLISGLELKNFFFHNEKNEKIAELNIKFNDNITADDIKRVKSNYVEMDSFVNGKITIFNTAKGQLDIEFNQSDAVTVNKVSGQGVGKADFYGSLLIINKLTQTAQKEYLTQMDPVFNNLVLIKSIYQEILTSYKRKEILDIAQSFAWKNYEHCVKELEAERIDFMSLCEGIDFEKLISEQPENVNISLVKDNADSFITYDKKVGRDAVRVALEFKDETLCNNIAKYKKKTCRENKVILDIPVEAKTY